MTTSLLSLDVHFICQWGACYIQNAANNLLSSMIRRQLYSNFNTPLSPLRLAPNLPLHPPSLHLRPNTIPHFPKSPKLQRSNLQTSNLYPRKEEMATPTSRPSLEARRAATATGILNAAEIDALYDPGPAVHHDAETFVEQRTHLTELKMQLSLYVQRWGGADFDAESRMFYFSLYPFSTSVFLSKTFHFHQSASVHNTFHPPISYFDAHPYHQYQATLLSTKNQH